MNAKNRLLHCRPFRPGPRLALSVLVIPRGDTAAVLTRASDLWQHHYTQALDNGNNHHAAKRFADLMAR